MPLLTNIIRVRAVRLIVLCTIPLLIPACKQVLPPEKVEYKIQLEPGSEWTWKCEIHGMEKSTDQFAPVVVTTPISLRLDLVVDSINSQGNYVMQATIKNYSIDVLFTVESQPLSADDVFGYDRDPQGEVARAVENKSLNFTIAPTGAILGVDGLSELRQEVESSFRFTSPPANKNLPPSAQKDFRNIFLQVLDNDFIPDLLETTFHVLPAGPVAVGDSWRVNLRNPANNETGEYALRLESRSDGLANLSHITSAEDRRVSPIGNRPYTLETGSVTLHEDSGIPIRHQQHIRSKYQVVIGQAREFEIDVKLSVDVIPK